MAVEADGVVRRIDEGDPSVDPALKEAAAQMGDVVVRSGKAAVRSTTYVTDRMTANPRQGGQVEATVIGWPLVVGGSVVAVLVGVDHGRPRRMPALPPELVDALALLVEPAAYALATCPARGPGRGPVGHRRPDPALQLALPQRRPAQGNQARHAQRVAAVAAVHRPGRVQAHQRRPRAPARQPGARSRRPQSSAAAPGRPTSWRGLAATSSPSCCLKPGSTAPNPSPAACGSASSGISFLADRGAGNRHNGVDRGSDAARCGRYCRRTAAGRRCGHVSGEGYREERHPHRGHARRTRTTVPHEEQELR